MPSLESATARIAGDFVALLVREVIGQIGTYIEIWNWTKAATIPQRVWIPYKMIYIGFADPEILIVRTHQGREHR